MEQEMKCALCGKRAMMLCESDQAKLCWNCDSKVHGANFLVAKHMRVLLCRHCHLPTPWKASGPSLTPSSSLCHLCTSSSSSSSNSLLRRRHHHQNYSSDDDDDDDEESISRVSEEEEEEEGDNQVVPWSSVSEEEEFVATSDDNSANSATGPSTSPLNRFQHHNVIHHSHDDEDEVGCCLSEGLVNNDEPRSMMNMLRPLKKARMSSHRDDDDAQWHNQRWATHMN